MNPRARSQRQSKIATRRFCRTVFLVLSMVAWCQAADLSAGEADVSQLILRAGNAEDEQTRYQLLKEAVSIPRLDAQVQHDVEGLLPIVDFWANKTYRPKEPRKRAAENGFLCGFFVGKV